MGKTSRDLYCLLSDILDVDRRRLTDAIDDMNMEVLSEAVMYVAEGAAKYGHITLDSILNEAFNVALKAVNFAAEDRNVPEGMDELDPAILDDCIYRDEDGYTFDPNCGVSMEEMAEYMKYYPKSFESLQMMLGGIDGLPDNVEESVESDADVPDQEFKLPVEWQVYDTITVQAKSLEAALRYTRDNADNIPLGTTPEYVDGSWKIKCDEGQSIEKLAKDVKPYL